MDPSDGVSLFDEPVSYVYSAAASYALMYLLYGLAVFAWERARVNHAYILEFPTRHCRRSTHIISSGLNLFIVIIGNIILYYKVRRKRAGVMFDDSSVAQALPAILMVGMVYTAFFPFEERRGVIAGTFETLKAPFGRVGFRENIIGDFLTSLVKPNTGTFYFRAQRRHNPGSLMKQLVFFHLSLRAMPVNTIR